MPVAEFGDLADALSSRPDTVNKFGMTREILTRLNAAGDRRIAVHREVIRRVVEFEDFTACYENERDAAKARVAEVRQLVNVKDSFTRMSIEREREAEKRRHEARQRAADIEAKKSAKMASRDALYAVFGEKDPHARARKFESALNAVFASEGILVRQSFTRIDDVAGTPDEQIDGVVEIDQRLYLVEAKWLAGPIDLPDLSRHLVRLWGRADCGGLVIGVNGFTAAAIAEATRALRDRVVVLCDLAEIVQILETDDDIAQYLRARIQQAILDRRPTAKS